MMTQLLEIINKWVNLAKEGLFCKFSLKNTNYSYNPILIMIDFLIENNTIYEDSITLSPSHFPNTCPRWYCRALPLRSLRRTITQPTSINQSK